MIVLSIIAIAFSAGLLLLSTSLVWAESHAATPAMMRHIVIQAFVSMSALGWVVLTPFRWRTKPLEIGALVAVAAGQMSLWQLLRFYDIVREWTIGPIILATIAVISVPLGFGAFLVRPSLDSSNQID